MKLSKNKHIAKNFKSRLIVRFALLALIFGSYIFYRNTVVQNADIYMIGQEMYGETSLEGILFLEILDDGSSSYSLLLESGDLVELQISDIDEFVGRLVRVAGVLNRVRVEGDLPFMQVNTLEVE